MFYIIKLNLFIYYAKESWRKNYVFERAQSLAGKHKVNWKSILLITTIQKLIFYQL